MQARLCCHLVEQQRATMAAMPVTKLSHVERRQVVGRLNNKQDCCTACRESALRQSGFRGGPGGAEQEEEAQRQSREHAGSNQGSEHRGTGRG